MLIDCLTPGTLFYGLECDFHSFGVFYITSFKLIINKLFPRFRSRGIRVNFLYNENGGIERFFWIKVANITSQSFNYLYAKNHTNRSIRCDLEEGQTKKKHSCIYDIITGINIAQLTVSDSIAINVGHS